MASRIRARFWDPTGSRYGIPTYPWNMTPSHLRTLRQLTAEGLRPGEQGVQGQVLWCSRRRGSSTVQAVYLYDVRLALPMRTTRRRGRVSNSKAATSRRTCPECLTDLDYVLPRHLGACLDCAEEAAA